MSNPASNPMTKPIKSLFAKLSNLFWVVVITLSISYVALAFLLFKSYNLSIRRSWARFVRRALNYEIKIFGEIKDVDMLIINHASMLDIIVLEEIYPKNLCWIAKKEIGELPFYGNIIKVPKMISIDRSSAKDFIRVMREAKERLKEGRILAIFPEGTRNNGKQLLPFKKGSAMLVDKLGLRAQMLVIKGSQDIMESRKMQLTRGLKLEIHFLELIDKSNPNWLEAAQSRMQEALDIARSTK